jgi:hypothetical protein
VESGHEEEHGHGPDEEHEDCPPRLAGTGTHVDRSMKDRVCACCCWDSLLSFPSRVHLHIYIGRQPAAEHHFHFHTCGETNG